MARNVLTVVSEGFAIAENLSKSINNRSKIISLV